MVEDRDGVEVIMDDVIIGGDEATHAERLMKFLERASEKGLQLYIDKCTADGLAFKGARLIVPKSLRPEIMLRQIPKSHLQIVKCRPEPEE